MGLRVATSNLNLPVPVNREQMAQITGSMRGMAPILWTLSRRRPFKCHCTGTIALSLQVPASASAVLLKTVLGLGSPFYVMRTLSVTQVISTVSDTPSSTAVVREDVVNLDPTSLGDSGCFLKDQRNNCKWNEVSPTPQRRLLHRGVPASACEQFGEQESEPTRN